MNNLFYAGVLGCVLATSAIAADPETAMVPQFRWVDPVNPGAPDMASCSISPGSVVSLIGREGNTVLLQVETGMEPSGLKTPCSRVRVFLTYISDFSTMTARYDSVRNAKSNRDALVERILKDVR